MNKEERAEWERSLKSGDKVFLDIKFDSEDEELLKLNKTIVTLKEAVCEDYGWYIEGHRFWMLNYNFRPIEEEVDKIIASSKSLINSNNSSTYCSCNSSNVVENYAGGKKFFYCRSCKKERLTEMRI